ncbi:type III-B CRISPR-associated protein Cas10/Cmr2 [Kerstersia gyiorum]|uniref:type III-B CRISPR-associated protein Cas10/Cmr2 n=1 Tax=Kerstersia gyiorum TaxID=206506 RepID=UPI003B433FE1
MTTDNTLWQTKLAARLHDPVEKAMVLLRDPAGHENGTSLALARLLGLHEIGTDTLDPDNDAALVQTAFKKSMPSSMYRHVQRADWWAAAADRPQWPMEQTTVPTKDGKTKTFQVANWAQVRWTNTPTLIHPLTGDRLELQQLSDTDFKDIKQRSFDHHAHLLQSLHRQHPDQDLNWRKALLTLWRFAPELSEDADNGKLGELWKLLPADTRIPDHSIWDHLDLTSAFAGAFAADPNHDAALLSLSIGPVQPFIAAARKMEDLWAGSHLLARLSWEAMRVVCERLGPDAILFPRLRGIPQVDLWLRDTCGLPNELFQACEWNQGSTDSNPLFAAALPNRFVAIVPASQAAALADAVASAVREWLQTKGDEIINRLLQVAGLTQDNEQYCHRQMREQLAGFPEVHWAAVPFSLIHCQDEKKQRNLDTTLLSETMRPFFDGDGEPGFLASPAWQVLRQDISWHDNTTFFAPNPGALYPAVHDLAERALAAAKALRPFKQNEQTGWRCSLTGETEWLTTDAAQLQLPAGQRRSCHDKNFKEGQHQETLWTRIADAKPAWAKPGEHLGALPAVKRLWPTLFAEEVANALGKKDIGRFVISTHTMALAHQIDQWLAHGGLFTPGLSAWQDRYKTRLERAALPPRLLQRHYRTNTEALKDAAQLPALLDWANEGGLDESEASAIRRAVRQTLAGSKDSESDDALETYYSLLLMDGDRLGAWLAGETSEGKDYAISYRSSFHPRIHVGFDEHAARQPRIQAYGQQNRALSPNRHLAISGALNDFSLTVVRHVIEHEHLGRLIYAGGDDVFAMLPVADLLSSMLRLRQVYAGISPAENDMDWGSLKKDTLVCKNGFAYLNGRLMRMMGRQATASCGAVIAHHQAPLSAVRRELHAAEQRAKNDGGRDAFSLTIIKRSGGALRLTAKWGEPISLLQDLRSFLAAEGVSRRAAYHTLQWLDANELPQPINKEMLQTLLAFQFRRQSQKSAQQTHELDRLAHRLAEQALQQERPPETNSQAITWLRNFISVAEFLAREVRHEI